MTAVGSFGCIEVGMLVCTNLAFRCGQALYDPDDTLKTLSVNTIAMLMQLALPEMTQLSACTGPILYYWPLGPGLVNDPHC